MSRNIEGRWIREVSQWRKIALNTWSEPDNPSVFGSIEVSVGPLLGFLEHRSAEAGVKCTVTHAVTRAVAMTLRRLPELNVLVRGHSVWQRDDVDVFLQVAMPEDERAGRADLSGALIRRADTLRVEEIAQQLQERARAVRERPELLDASPMEVEL